MTEPPRGFLRPTTRVMLYIFRRTFGFRKDRDAISFNQFQSGIKRLDGTQVDYGCGVRNRTAISDALKGLIDRGLITASKSRDARGENETTVYEVHFVDNSGTDVVRPTYHRSTPKASEVVRPTHPQQTDVQHTVKQHGEQPRYERFVET